MDIKAVNQILCNWVRWIENLRSILVRCLYESQEVSSGLVISRIEGIKIKLFHQFDQVEHLYLQFISFFSDRSPWVVVHGVQILDTIPARGSLDIVVILLFELWFLFSQVNKLIVNGEAQRVNNVVTSVIFYDLFYLFFSFVSHLQDFTAFFCIRLAEEFIVLLQPLWEVDWVNSNVVVHVELVHCFEERILVEGATVYAKEIKEGAE